MGVCPRSRKSVPVRRFKSMLCPGFEGKSSMAAAVTSTEDHGECFVCQVLQKAISCEEDVRM